MWLILTERNCFVLHICQCCIVWYNTAFSFFIFCQVWQRLPWQKLWSYRKWSLWQWIAFMEVVVKTEQNRKMKSSILMQVSNARESCRGALNTRSCAWETNKQTISQILVLFCFVSIALPVSNQNYCTRSSSIPPVFLLTDFINFLKNSGEGLFSLC